MRFSLITVSSLVAAAYAAPAALNDVGVNGAIDSVRITDNTLNTGTVNAPVNADVDGTISRVTGQITNNEVEVVGARDVKGTVTKVETAVTQVRTHITKINGVVTSTKTTIASEKTKALQIVDEQVKFIVGIVTPFIVDIREVFAGTVKLTDEQKKAIFDLVNLLVKDISILNINVSNVFGIGKSSQESIPGFILTAPLEAFKIIGSLNIIELSTITVLLPLQNIQDLAVLALAQGVIGQIKLPVKVL